MAGTKKLDDAPRNYYDLLEVSSRARAEVVEAAYKTLIKIFHPDKPTGDENKARALNEAYKIISDSASRADYDRAGKKIAR